MKKKEEYIKSFSNHLINKLTRKRYIETLRKKADKIFNDYFIIDIKSYVQIELLSANGYNTYKINNKKFFAVKDKKKIRIKKAEFEYLNFLNNNYKLNSKEILNIRQNNINKN